MYQKKIEDRIKCPLEYCLSMMSGKWKFRIICVLSDSRQFRYQDIKNELEDISDSVLSLALREMARDGLIVRKSYDEVPPKVVYSLTELGRSVTPVMREMCRWSSAHFCGDASDMLSRCKKCEIPAKRE